MGKTRSSFLLNLGTFFGKLHELAFYGVISSCIYLFAMHKKFDNLIQAGFHPAGYSGLFQAYIFWSLLLFLPISVISALFTKYYDDGDGLYFHSDKLLIIMFANIAEEIYGLFCSPFWLIRDVCLKDYRELWQVIDYATYLLEIILIIIGFFIIY